jgi:hypothetical protein
MFTMRTINLARYEVNSPSSKYEITAKPSSKAATGLSILKLGYEQQVTDTRLSLNAASIDGETEELRQL